MRSLLHQIEYKVELEEGVKIETRMYGWKDGPEARAKRYILDHHRRCPSYPLVLLGHSYGGDSAVDVAYPYRDIPVVDLVVTLDPVSHNFRSPDLKRTMWVNIYRSEVPIVIAPWVDLFRGPAALINWITGSRTKQARRIACGIAATWGGHWGSESGADRNIKAKAASDHCDIFGLYEPAHKYVVKALTK